MAMTSKDFDKILHRYNSGTCTEEERQLVEAWFKAMEDGEDETFTNRTETDIKAQLWRNLNSELDLPKAAKHNFYFWKISRVAAALAFILVSIFLVKRYFSDAVSESNSIVSAGGKTIRFVNTTNTTHKLALQDGSIVTLQPGSELKYPEVFTTQREVYLTGEAFFEVAKDAEHPFLVYTHEVTTKVLGTSFRIKAYEQEKEIIVAVKTGKVSVFTQPRLDSSAKSAAQEFILTPNQQVIYDRKEALAVRSAAQKSTGNVTQQPVQVLSYTNAPVASIFKTLEESYGVNIQFNEQVLSGCTLTSDMTDENLYQQLEIICNALGARYEVTETSIVIDAQGCN
jgi:ferric-dicitrate binding protein FerR (iron transport regulator)